MGDIFYDNIINLVSSDTSWVADTGAAIHVTSRRDLFATYTVGEFGSLRMGNNDVSKVVGMGDICLKMSSGVDTKFFLFSCVLFFT